MAMRPRGGAQVPRSQFVVRPTYEDFEPKFEEKEEPTAYMLHVYLPGFAREQLKVTYDGSKKKIKTRGERPLGNYRWSRFEKEFNIPDNCVVPQIKGKFEKNVLTITMPKKVIVTKPQEPVAKKMTEVAAASPPSKPAAAAADEPKKVQEDIPPKATTTTTSSSSTAAAIPKAKEEKPARSPTPIPKKPEPESQKGQQDLSPQQATTQPMPQKVQDQIPSKQTHQNVEQKAMEEDKRTAKKEKESSEKGKEPATAETASQDLAKKKEEKRDGEEPKHFVAKEPKETKDVTTSAKEVLGRLAGKLNEDDNRQSLINAGVAALVIIALGAYIAYTIGSGDETKN